MFNNNSVGQNTQVHKTAVFYNTTPGQIMIKGLGSIATVDLTFLKNKLLFSHDLPFLHLLYGQ